MASFDSLSTRELLKRGFAAFVTDDTVANTGPVAIRLRYVGTGTVTSVTVTTATNIVMITSDGGTDTYAFNALTTIGAVVDAINADGIFQAKVLDTLRSIASASSITNGAITAHAFEGELVWDALVDTSAIFNIGYRISFDRGFKRNKIKDQHRVSLKEIIYVTDVGAASKINVYEIDKYGTATLVYSRPAVDHAATENTITFASGHGEITANDGNDLLVIAECGTSLANGCYMNVTGEIA